MVAVVIWRKIHIIVNMAGEEMRSHYGKTLVGYPMRSIMISIVSRASLFKSSVLELI